MYVNEYDIWYLRIACTETLFNIPTCMYEYKAGNRIIHYINFETFFIFP